MRRFLNLSPILLASFACSCTPAEPDNPFVTTFDPTTMPGDGDGDPTETGDPGDGDGDGDGDPSGSCGDGVLDMGEQCDLGPANAENGQCTPACNIAICGDGLVYEGFEECDDGNPDNTDDCIDDCALAVCGDGYTHAGIEECDDGDADEADGCTTSCTPGVCGDGVVQQGEQCDDANMITTDTCPACQLAFCGDGYMQAGVEACDDGNLESNDACTSPLCEPGVCGDGIVYEGMEECDDANAEDGDMCTNGCTTAVCGDGITQDGVEECDDGNDNEDDGCDSQCIASADPQCFLAYNQFTNGNRNKTTMNGQVFCDSQIGNEWLGPGWYRFTGAAGTRMSEVSIPQLSCSTHAPGWINGVHPTLADGVVMRQVCFHWSNNTCNWNTMIQVVACPGYYLYYLPTTPVCSLRYCGQD